MSMPNRKYDAVVVGSGPNGLAAAITMARAGRSVLVLEGAPTAGGGIKTAELTLPGFIHDVCSAAHPMAVASEFFRNLPLEKFGLEWIYSASPFAQPLDNGAAVRQFQSVEETAAQFPADEKSYISLMKPLVDRWQELTAETLGPILHFPQHPLFLAKFGIKAILPATTLAKLKFQTPEARALFGGVAAHSSLPLTYTSSAAIGLVLSSLGHAVGWPIPKGGSGQIAKAMIDYFKSIGGEIECNRPVQTLQDLPESKWIFLDVTPRQALEIVGDRFPKMFRRRMARFQYGPGVFKLDWALSSPIPWTSGKCATAATVHVGGTLEEMVQSEAGPVEGRCPERPYVLLGQPSLFDSTRAPHGKHTVWAYCHVPNGSEEDMTERMENQIERFAPGFKKLILKRSTLNPSQLQNRNPNLIGGDISGGSTHFKQLIWRPTSPFSPYSTPDPKIFMCSSSTPPGPGVHGMCGFNAANDALAKSL